MRNTNKFLGMRIKNLRERYGYTQNELSSLTNLSLKNLGELERGRGNPSLSSLLKVAEVFRISVSELFDFDQEEKNQDVLKEEIALRLQTARPEVVTFIHKVLKP